MKSLFWRKYNRLFVITFGKPLSSQIKLHENVLPFQFNPLISLKLYSLIKQEKNRDLLLKYLVVCIDVNK